MFINRILSLTIIKRATSSARLYHIISKKAESIVIPIAKTNLRSYTWDSERKFSTKMADIQIVTYEDVVSYKDKPDVLLIDVREPNEIKETGAITGSINIPLGELTSALQDVKPEDFKKKYGRDMPEKSTQLVFSCKMGGRATKAMQEASCLGYNNVKVYKGSWMDWNEHQK